MAAEKIRMKYNPLHCQTYLLNNTRLKQARLKIPCFGFASRAIIWFAHWYINLQACKDVLA
jgi:hypothetical protein